MSLECICESQASIPMSISGSSAASESPESEHAVSVLDFAERYAAGTAPQVFRFLLAHPQAGLQMLCTAATCSWPLCREVTLVQVPADAKDNETILATRMSDTGNRHMLSSRHPALPASFRAWQSHLQLQSSVASTASLVRPHTTWQSPIALCSGAVG